MEAAVGLVLERRRTGWDVLFGALTVVAGAIVLGHTTLAGTISVLFVGWMLLVAGSVLVGAALLGWTDPTRRFNLAFGVLVGLLGAGFVANPGAALATLTWVAGSLLLLGGVLRLVLAFQPGSPTGVLLYGGTVQAVLGLLLLLAWPGSARWFLGTALGVQLLVDGASTMLIGRWRLQQIRSEARTDEAAEAPTTEDTPDEPAATPSAEERGAAG
jgi:membrane protein HdeD